MRFWRKNVERLSALEPGCAIGVANNRDATKSRRKEIGKKKVVGTVQVIIASLMYGIEPSIHAFALKSGLHATQTITMRVFVALVLTILLCCLKKSQFPLPRKEKRELVFAGIFGLGLTGVLLSLSYQYIPVGMATVIHFLYPSLTCIASTILLRERMPVSSIFAIVLSIGGLYVIGRQSMAGDWQGVFYAFLSAVSFTLYLCLCGHKANDANLNSRMLYIWGGSLIICIIFRLFSPATGSWTLQTVGIMIVCGILNGLANVLLAAGILRIGASVAAFFCLLEPISSVIFSALLYHNRFSSTDVLGGTLFLLAILIISIQQLYPEQGKRGNRYSKTQ